VPFPKLARYKSLAILGDVVSAPKSIIDRHVKGANVLYGNGGAKWVDLKAFATELNKCSEPYTHTYDAFQDNVWVLLDRQ
jgi:hypothetical protein